MTVLIKPLLASDAVQEEIRFPVFGSGKIDGFRSFHDQVMLSRSRKPMPNNFVRATLANSLFDRLDGELTVGSPTDPKVFQGTSGALRAIDGEPDFSWHIFDDITNPNDPFEKRLDSAASRVERLNDIIDAPRLRLVEHKLIRNMDELDEFESIKLAEGYEGVMIRDPNGRYKFGRSTVKEGILLKVKRMSHEEGEIVDFVELLHNENEAFVDELGRTKRSDHAENLVPSGMLGAFVVRSPKYAKDFRVSASSMTLEERRTAWGMRDVIRNSRRLVRYKFFAHGMKDVPRHAVFAGFRDYFDL
jgi:DNA ligase-1